MVYPSQDDAFDFEPKREPLDSASSAGFGSDVGDEVKSPLDREESFDLSEATIKSDDTNELEELLCDMMIQSSSTTFQHPRAVQGYGHGVNSFRQSSYHHQVSSPTIPFARRYKKPNFPRRFPQWMFAQWDKFDGISEFTWWNIFL